MQRSALCRSRRELSNAYLLAKFGFDTAENEPCKVCPLSVYRSPRSWSCECVETSTSPTRFCSSRREPVPSYRSVRRFGWLFISGQSFNNGLLEKKGCPAQRSISLGGVRRLGRKNVLRDYLRAVVRLTSKIIFLFYWWYQWCNCVVIRSTINEL